MSRRVRVWGFSLGLTMVACSGRVDVGVEPTDEPAGGSAGSSGGSSATGGKAGSAPTAGGGAAGPSEGGASSACEFGPTEVGADPRPLLSSADVLARIFQFLENDPSIPAGALPDEPTPAWAAARAKGILDLHEAAGTPAPGLQRFLEHWLEVAPDQLEAPSIWASKLVAGDATLATLLAEPTGEPHRFGILNDAEVLAARPSITERGMLISSSALCQPIPPPPDGPPHPLSAPAETEGTTRRERHENSVSTQPQCAGCHRLADAGGYSLEHFDEAGDYRELDNGKPINAAAMLHYPELSFDDYADLAPQLASSCEVAHCMARLLGRDAMGLQLWEELPGFSEPEINAIAREFVDSGYSIRALVDGIVRSPSFLR